MGVSKEREREPVRACRPPQLFQTLSWMLDAIRPCASRCNTGHGRCEDSLIVPQCGRIEHACSRPNSITAGMRGGRVDKLKTFSGEA